MVVTRIEIESRRATIGVVSQETILFNDTLERNTSVTSCGTLPWIGWPSVMVERQIASSGPFSTKSDRTWCRVVSGRLSRSSCYNASASRVIPSISAGKKSCRKRRKPKVSKWAICFTVSTAYLSYGVRSVTQLNSDA